MRYLQLITDLAASAYRNVKEWVYVAASERVLISIFATFLFVSAAIIIYVTKPALLWGQSEPTDIVTQQAKAGDGFGNWIYECLSTPDGKSLCSLTQTLLASDSKQPIAKFSVGRDAKSNGVIFGALVPLGLDIPSGINLTLDDSLVLPLTILTCSQNGCLSHLVLTPKILKALTSAKTITVSFVFRGADKPAILVGSLDGLAAGVSAAGYR